MNLSPRLAAIARMIPQGAALADIGSDHAYLPIYMIRKEAVASAIASDISGHCIARARANAERAGVEDRISFRVADGLCGIRPDECDTIVIAGMGGETAAAILAACPWAAEKRLVLQPASRADFLRRRLYQHGCGIADERVVRDAGRLYAVFTALRGVPVPDGALYGYASPPLLAQTADPDVRAYLLRTADALGREVGRDHAAVIAALREAAAGHDAAGAE